MFWPHYSRKGEIILNQRFTAQFTTTQQAQEAAELVKAHFQNSRVRLWQAGTASAPHYTMPLPAALGGGLSSATLYAPASFLPTESHPIQLSAELSPHRKQEWQDMMIRLGGKLM